MLNSFWQLTPYILFVGFVVIFGFVVAVGTIERILSNKK